MSRVIQPESESQVFSGAHGLGCTMLWIGNVESLPAPKSQISKQAALGAGYS